MHLEILLLNAHELLESRPIPVDPAADQLALRGNLGWWMALGTAHKLAQVQLSPLMFQTAWQVESHPPRSTPVDRLAFLPLLHFGVWDRDGEGRG